MGTKPIQIIAVLYQLIHTIEMYSMRVTPLKASALQANAPGHLLSNTFHVFDSPCIHAVCRADGLMIILQLKTLQTTKPSQGGFC
jgi:hypothetical protein